jgi:hypothetical protein
MWYARKIYARASNLTGRQAWSLHVMADGMDSTDSMV